VWCVQLACWFASCCVGVFSWRVGVLMCLRAVVLVCSVGVLVCELLCLCVQLACWYVGVFASCCVGMLRVDVLVCWYVTC
jgi:hypothetical protein